MQHEVSTLPNLSFVTNTFVGNLGAPLRVGNDEDEDEELQGLGNDEHELQEQDREGQGALLMEDAW